MRLTPHKARFYLLLAAFMMALPTLAGINGGHSGKLLVATPRVSSGPFERSVIYLVWHNFFSAHGFIVNRPSPEGYIGGPVSPEMLSIMQQAEDGGITFASTVTAEGRKLYGYAGWGPMQLNYEIFRGLWDVIDYDPALVFSIPEIKIWPAARARVAAQAGETDFAL